MICLSDSQGLHSNVLSATVARQPAEMQWYEMVKYFKHSCQINKGCLSCSIYTLLAFKYKFYKFYKLAFRCFAWSESRMCFCYIFNIPHLKYVKGMCCISGNCLCIFNSYLKIICQFLLKAGVEQFNSLTRYDDDKEIQTYYCMAGYRLMIDQGYFLLRGYVETPCVAIKSESGSEQRSWNTKRMNGWNSLIKLRWMDKQLK